MKTSIAWLTILLLAAAAVDSVGKETKSRALPFDRASLPGELASDRPSVRPTPTHMRADTSYFGNIGGDGFAVADGVWDWDGGSDPLQGWYAVDLTTDGTSYFRQIDADVWTTGTGNEVAAPILNGAGSLWVGAFENEADALCWPGGLGYGNLWCQRALSPVLQYSGSGDVSLSFEYFNDSELNFDYTSVLLRRIASDDEIALDGFTGQIGLATNHPAGIPAGAIFFEVMTPTDFQGETQFQVVFEFTSDRNWSDEDASYSTEYGPFGADDVLVSGSVVGGSVAYAFESGLDGWLVEACAGIGSFLGVRESSLYDIQDPCDCDIAGNALEFHDEAFEHPDGQHSFAVSNPVDVLNDVPPPPGDGGLGIFARWDQYTDLPRANGVFYRPGWDYYPWICPVTGVPQWSGRVGNDLQFFYTGDQPICSGELEIATLGGVPVSGVEQIRFLYELYATCDVFGIPPEICSGITNFTPIIDNVRIGFVEVQSAPAISFAAGTQYQDTYAATDRMDPNAVGRADVVVNTNFGNTPPFIAGDSLYVAGPFSTPSTRWEARLWFRINREGPGAKPPRYNAWKVALADGKNITGGEFTFAWMDSFQIGTNTARNKFVSYLRETGEDDYNWDGGGELSDRNEVIRDDILVAGTEIDYFVTSNYTVSPTQNFVLPDTTGQFFNEFAVLPRWVSSSGFKYPCLLYVDAFNGGAEFFITNALDALGVEYDKYDYLDASSNWKNPMARGTTSIDENSGIHLVHMLGYKSILVNTGTLSGQTMWPEDFVLLSDWLTAPYCDGNINRAGLFLNGDNVATILESTGPAFLTQLGTTQVADGYNQLGAPPDENYCVHVESPTIPGKYGTFNSHGDYDYDAYGNWCPQVYSFDVLGAAGTGVGNRAFVNVGNAAATNFAQVVNQVDAAARGNYRSVVDGVSFHHLAERDGGPGCASDSAHIVTAVSNEIAAAMEWFFGVGGWPSFCLNPCNLPVDVPESPIGLDIGSTRLYQNSPNPFNPRTVLRFSLAQTGHAELSIYDVNGRLVKTLVNGSTEAGLHEVVWDGTDDAGNPVASGVFWSQLSADGFSSNKKMVVLR